MWEIITSFMRYAVLLIAIVLFSACKPAEVANTNSASSAAKRYDLKGKVVSVDKAAKKATIEHDAIDGFMDAMTMDFPIHEDWVWNDLVPGSEIRAELVVDNTAKDPYWLEKIGILAAAKPGQAVPAVDEPALPAGDPPGSAAPVLLQRQR